MKMMRKLATLLLAVCLIVPGFSMVASAASGQVMFTDPETAVGQTVEVKGVLKADSNIEDRKISMKYDTTMLKFVEGDNVTESSEGKLTYEVKGKKDTDRVEFLMKFTALKEGTTKLEVENYEAWNTNNEKIDCTKGSSTIKIEAGDGTTTAPQEPVETTDVTVTVDGVLYTLASTFEDSVVPEGFSKTEFDYQGTTCTAVANENASMFLGYLVDADGNGEFFLYMMETATFVPFESIKISDIMVIALLSDTSDVVLPEQYMTTEVIVNGAAYPAWQNVEDTSYCVLYALNSNGEKALYRYDVAEGTYQRFAVPEVATEQEDESAITKLADLLEGNMAYVVLGAGLGFILLVLIIIILGVKLHNRNAELDEIYEEYGIDLDDEYEHNIEDREDDSNVIRIADAEDSDEEVEVEFFEEESEGIFVDIDDEIEEDIMFTEEDDEEVEVEFFEEKSEEPAVVEETKEFAVKDIETALEKINFDSEETLEETEYDKEEYDEGDYDDDDFNDDFEMSFIDLDD